MKQIAPQINSTNSQKLRQDIETSQKFRRQYDFVRRFTAMAGQLGTVEIPLPSEGDFQILGYNISYAIPTGGTESLFLKFRQQDGGRAWSNDYLPARGIATPGVVGSPRYGFRQFEVYLRKNDKISIDWSNQGGTQDISVEVVFTGYIWPVFGK